jgi:hypothetical protein
MVRMTNLWRIVICEAPVAVPNNRTIGPTPCLKKHAQNIRLGLCFTVTETQEMLYSSLGSRQTLLHRDCWNWEKVDSSLHRTFDQSSFVQLWCSKHHARHASIFTDEIRGLCRVIRLFNPTARSAWPIVRVEITWPVFLFQNCWISGLHKRRFFPLLLVTDFLSQFCCKGPRRNDRPEWGL